MFRMGLSVDCALISPGSAFACPGVVTATTPSLPVMRAHDSAMCTAACSWRQSISRKSSSYRHVQQRKDVVAGESEDRVDPFLPQRPRDDLRSAYRHVRPAPNREDAAMLAQAQSRLHTPAWDTPLACAPAKLPAWRLPTNSAWS